MLLPISEILYDEEFRLSRQASSEFSDSVRLHGVLNSIKVFPDGNRYRIFSGHNRYNAASGLGATHISCDIVALPDNEMFLSEAVLRSFSSSLSLRGRLALLRRLGDIVNNYPEIKIPRDLSSDEAASRILSLPENLLAYMDMKDAPLKLADCAAKLSSSTVGMLSSIASRQLSLSSFRKIVSLCSDIERLGKPEAIVESFSGVESSDEIEQRLSFVMYPNYSRYCSLARGIEADARKLGFDVVFTGNFEGNSADVKIKIRRNDSVENFRKTAGKMDENIMKRICGLLE